MTAAPGVLVARGSDLTVARIALSTPATVITAGQSRTVDSVYRVTVTAGPYVVRDMPAVLAVGSTPLGVAAESEDLSALVLYTYDDAVLSAGGTVTLTYGMPGEAAPQWSTTIEVLP